MAKNKTRGWYYFEDGYYAWFNGMSAAEKKGLIQRHGKLLRFQWTD